MRIGVLEWASSGNAIGSQSLPASIRMEGWAMCRAALLSLTAGGHQAVAVVDAQCAQDPHVAHLSSRELELHIGQPDKTPHSQWRSVYGGCECTLVIAPEFHGVLDELLQWFKEQGIATCNCGRMFVRRASDKGRTARRLHASGLPHPPTRLLATATRSWVNATSAKLRSLTGDEPIWVNKPRDGVGCDGIERLTARDITRIRNEQAGARVSRKELSRFIVQPWLSGQALSRACLIDCQGIMHWLPVARQNISVNEKVIYRGGTIEPHLAREIPELDSLLESAIRSLGGRPRGWVGIDFLWDRASLTQPVTIIEINPRLTTSFVGLCAAGAPDLASCIVAACLGENFHLPTHWQRQSFTAGGESCRETE